MAHGAFRSITRVCSKTTYAAMFAKELSSILTQVYKKSALLLAAFELGGSYKYLQHGFLSGLRFYCPPATWLVIYPIRTGVVEKNALLHHTLCTDDSIGYV